MSKLKQSEIDLTSAINELHWLNFNLGNAMLCIWRYARGVRGELSTLEEARSFIDAEIEKIKEEQKQ